MVETCEYKYVFVNGELDIHYWGNECLVVDNISKIYRLSALHTDIVACCKETNDINILCSEILGKYFCPEELIEQAKEKIISAIYSLVKNKILILTNDINYKCVAVYSGKRGYYYPQSVNIELTNRCNFLCQHCYKNAGAIGTYITKETMKHLFEILSEKTQSIQFSGGEPTLHPDFCNFVVEFSKSFDLSLVTNGSLFYTFPDYILSRFSSVQFSLYGYSPEQYKVFTGNDLGYYALIKSVDVANRLGIEYQLCVTLGKNTINQIEKYILFACEIGAKKIKFGLPSASGRSLSDYLSTSNYILEKSDINIAYREIKRLKLKYKEKIFISLWGHVDFVSNQRRKNIYDKDNLISCGAGSYTYVVSQEGKVRPCEFLPEDIFDMGDISIIYDFIKGDFHIEDFKSKIRLFRKNMNACDISLYSVCSSIEPYFNQCCVEKNEMVSLDS